MTAAQPLSSETLKSLTLAKVFHDNQKPILDLDFDDSGEFCVTSSLDEQIVLYDCRQASKKYGIHHVKFVHNASTILHSSTKEDDTIRYLSLHDNKYIRYFRGHQKRVVSMALSPVNDQFLSGSADDTVRLWDVRSSNCQGVCHVKGAPTVAFDPEGVCFAIGVQNTIRLYDLRNFDKGPFGSVPQVGDTSYFQATDYWTGIEFSNNKRDLLISTKDAKIYVVDSVDYRVRHVLTGFQNTNKSTLKASFTPDGNFITSGSENGSIHIWNVQTGEKEVELPGHANPVGVCRFNPKYLMLVSGCTNFAFWIPGEPLKKV